MASARDLVMAARAGVEGLTPAQVAAEQEQGDPLVVDVREADETAAGTIPGATPVPRGLLEFAADPGTPMHVEGFDPARRVICYCSGGGRSALAAQSLQALGYTDVAHLEGGFGAWTAEGRPVAPPT
jgi:rhodanese-related sulfurtransferase